MPKTKKVEYYGRLGHDTDIAEVRETIKDAKEALSRMEMMLDNSLSFDEACEQIHWLWAQTQTMMACPMLRPIFLSHLIGRLREDGLPLTKVAEKAGTSKQMVNHMLYHGAAGRPTNVPRTRPKKAVV